MHRVARAETPGSSGNGTASSSPRVLLILGHPRTESLSYALGDAYEKGARAAGASVRRLELAAMQFEQNVEEVSPRNQSFEEDLVRARELITWADHLVFVYPTWWGTVPALLKGFLDRVFTGGFAFNEIEGGTGYEPLLGGKTARLITTRDTPGWVYRWVYRQPGHNAMKRATLNFCGIEPVRVASYGPVKAAGKEEREGWLERERRAGERLRGGVMTGWERGWRRGRSWLKALRLQFYPMTWMAYTAGALGASRLGYSFDSSTYWLGYACLFFMEAATVFSNDYFDIESDQENEYFSPFTGGSRVLVEGEVSAKDMRYAIAAALTATAAGAGALVWTAAVPAAAVLVPLLLLAVLALGYTVPPLKFSHRGLGEVDVGLTHSVGVIVAGFMFQGGSWHEAFPWLLSVPLFLAVLPAILLSGIPDYEADKAAGKRTLVVKLGPERAVWLAGGLLVAAALAGTLWYGFGLAHAAYGAVINLAWIHAAYVCYRLRGLANQPEPPTRIDRTMVFALMYILWFAAVPLVSLW